MTELFLPEIQPATYPDRGDTKFLQCAQAAQADYIVTGNKRDFPARSYGVTHVVSAGELLIGSHWRSNPARTALKTEENLRFCEPDHIGLATG
jgi:hypothetical protein